MIKNAAARSDFSPTDKYEDGTGTKLGTLFSLGKIFFLNARINQRFVWFALDFQSQVELPFLYGKSFQLLTFHRGVSFD